MSDFTPRPVRNSQHPVPAIREAAIRRERERIGGGWRGSWATISDEDRDTFLMHVTNGDHRVTAARKVGHTANEFRALTKHDEEFRRAYAEALEGHEDKIRDLWWEKAQESERLLLEQANTYLPERAYVRKQTVEHSGPEGRPIQHEQRLTLADVARFAAERGLGAEAPENSPDRTERIERIVDRVVEEHRETLEKLADE